jgi:uncharacterized membrane protein YphA (DoxX/SURF4 family)
MSMEKTKKIFINIARLLLGVSFVFSGFVKVIDPLGFSYKIKDYFEAFGWTSFSELSFLIGVTLAAVELFLGASLLLGVWKRSISLLLLLFMSIITPFTLYLAIKNPVSDCGCFGDALIITNWQTFYKNIFLLFLAIPIFLWSDLFYVFFGNRTGRWSAYWCLLFPFMLSFYCVRHLPLLDFRPYKIGNHLIDFMTIPEGAVRDSFDTRFVYAKNGVQEEFSIDKAPLSDPQWVFVSRKDIQIRKGYTPTIHDFVLEHPTKGDITDEVLKDTSYTFLLVSSKLEESNRNNIAQIESAAQYAQEHLYAFYGLTNSGSEAIDEWNYEYDTKIDFCTVDDRTLKTIIRSNPGLVLLKNGVVIQKWAFRDIPDFSNIKLPLSDTKWGHVKSVNVIELLAKVFLLFLIPVFIFFLLHRGYRFHFTYFQKRKTNSSNI